MSNRTPVPERYQEMMTEKQVKYIIDLIQDRDLSSLSAVQLEWLDAFDAGTNCTKQKASQIIKTLIELPKKRLEHPMDLKLPDLPPGRYAVEGEDGELRFYVLDKPTEGRWAGYVFLSVMASDEKHPIKNRSSKQTIMNRIAVDPQAAMNRFGEEIGACGVCGRTLTNQDSRARGIGPICAGKYREQYGWWS